jgi:hypothetical protein
MKPINNPTSDLRDPGSDGLRRSIVRMLSCRFSHRPHDVGPELLLEAGATQERTLEAVSSRPLCTPGMGVSVGVEVPCRRFTFMNRKIHEDNYESKARASPRGGV